MSDVAFSAPGLDEEAPRARNTILSSLKDELGTPPVFEKEAIIKVPGKSRVTLKVSTELPMTKLERIQRASYKNKKKQNVDITAFNARLISNQTICIQLDGEDQVDADGEYLDFHSEDVQEWLQAVEAAGAVRVLFPRDPDLIDAGGEIMEAAGYGDQGEDDDEEGDNDPLD